MNNYDKETIELLKIISLMTGPVSGPEFWAASKETCNKQNL